MGDNVVERIRTLKRDVIGLKATVDAQRTMDVRPQASRPLPRAVLISAI